VKLEVLPRTQGVSENIESELTIFIVAGNTHLVVAPVERGANVLRIEYVAVAPVSNSQADTDRVEPMLDTDIAIQRIDAHATWQINRAFCECR